MSERNSTFKDALAELYQRRNGLNFRLEKLNAAIEGLEAIEAENDARQPALFPTPANGAPANERKRSVPGNLINAIRQFIAKQTDAYSITELRAYLQGPPHNYSKKAAGYDVAEAMRLLEGAGEIKVKQRGMGRRAAIYEPINR